MRLSHASPSTAAIFRCVYALPFLGLLKWLEDRRYGARSWRQRRTAIGAGVFFAADLILWTHSIEDVGAGLSTVLANVQVVLVPLIAWMVLSEQPGRALLMALPLTAIGVLMISGLLEHGAYGSDPGSGALFGVSAGIAYAGFILLLRHGGADLRRPAGPLFDATATAAVVAVIVGVVVGDARLVPTWPSAGWLLTLALSSQVLGWMLITISLPRLPAAITSLLLMLDAGRRDARSPRSSSVNPRASCSSVASCLILVALVVATQVATSRRRGLPEQVLLALPGSTPPLQDRRRASRGDRRRGPATAGCSPSLRRARSAVAASSSATAINVARSTRPFASGAPAPILGRFDAGAPDRDVALSDPPGAAERVGDHHRRARDRSARAAAHGAGVRTRRGRPAAIRPSPRRGRWRRRRRRSRR